MRILFIDDDLATLALLNGYTHKSEHTCIFTNRPEDVRIHDLTTFDFIVTDYMMSSMNGLKVIEYASKENPNLLFAMITAIDDKDTIQKAFDFNIIDYLVKPVKKQETLELIENAKRKIENRNLEKNINEKLKL